MATMETDMVVPVAPQQVFDTLADLEGVSHWNPTIDRAECITEQRTGLGAQRRCYMHPSGWVVESINEWDPPHVVGFRVENAPPLKSGQGRFVLTAVPGGTRIQGSFEYEVRFGPLGPVIDKLVVHRQLSAGWTAGMGGLRAHLDPAPSG